jgi:hypothetical protein
MSGAEVVTVDGATQIRTGLSQVGAYEATPPGAFGQKRPKPLAHTTPPQCQAS